MKTLILAMLFPVAAVADIEMRFIEGAPKDRFEFVNAAPCATGPVRLEIDMSDSVGGLYFDTSSAGAGIEVFQPFQIVSGGALIKDTVQVSDGETSLAINLRDFPAGAQLAFTIDVDDTLRHGSLGQTQVARSEIAGTSVKVISAGENALGVIDNTASARVPIATCIS